MIDAGYLPAVRLGRRIKVPPESLAILATEAAALVGTRPKPTRSRDLNNGLQDLHRSGDSTPDVVGKQAADALRKSPDGFTVRVRSDGTVAATRRKTRGNYMGSVFQRHDRPGRFIVEYYPTKEDQRTATFRSAEAAETFLADENSKRRAAETEKVRPSPITLKSTLDELMVFVTATCYTEEATVSNLTRCVRLLRDVVPDRSERVLANYTGDGAYDAALNFRYALQLAVFRGRGPVAANALLAALRLCFRRYIDYPNTRRCLKVNPFEGVADVDDPDKVPATREDDFSDVAEILAAEVDPKRYTFERVAALLKSIGNHWIFPAIAIQILADLRVGEVCALLYGNYEPDEGRLMVRRSIKISGVRGDTKESIKDIFLTTVGRNIMRWVLDMRAQELGRPLRPTDPIFVHSTGDRFKPSGYSAVVKSAVSAFDYRFYAYAFRDAGATMARNALFTPEELALHMAHAFDTPMNNRYGDTLRSRDVTRQGSRDKLERYAEVLVGWWTPELLIRHCVDCGGPLPVRAEKRRKYCDPCGKVGHRGVQKRSEDKKRLAMKICTKCGADFEAPAAKMCPSCRHKSRSDKGIERWAQRHAVVGERRKDALDRFNALHPWLPSEG